MSKPERDWPGVYAEPRLRECPGFGRACGVLTPRPLCFFCTKSLQLELEKRR